MIVAFGSARWTNLAAIGVMSGLNGALAAETAYPNRPVRVVVASAPGGGAGCRHAYLGSKADRRHGPDLGSRQSIWCGWQRGR